MENLTLSQLHKEAEKYRSLYKKGARLVLISMDDPYAPVETGTHGTLEYIDDASQFHMSWDNGRTLALVPQVDKFRNLTDLEYSEEMRLWDFASGIVKTMLPGHAARSFIMMDHCHGVRVQIDSTGSAPKYVVEACNFDYDSAQITPIPGTSTNYALYHNADALWKAALYVISKELPGWDTCNEM